MRLRGGIKPLIKIFITSTYLFIYTIPWFKGLSLAPLVILVYSGIVSNILSVLLESSNYNINLNSSLLLSFLDTQKSLHISLLFLFFLIKLYYKTHMGIYIYGYIVLIPYMVLNINFNEFYIIGSIGKDLNITPELLNGLFFIHPLLLFLSIISSFTALLINKHSLIINYNLKLAINIDKGYNIELLGILLLIIACIITGSWWAQQELNWDGWWSWDIIECILLAQLLVLIIAFHFIGYNNQHLLVFSSYLIGLTLLLTRFNLIITRHSFLNSSQEIQHSFYGLFTIIVIILFTADIIVTQLVFTNKNKLIRAKYTLSAAAKYNSNFLLEPRSYLMYPYMQKLLVPLPFVTISSLLIVIVLDYLLEFPIGSQDVTSYMLEWFLYFYIFMAILNYKSVFKLYMSTKQSIKLIPLVLNSRLSSIVYIYKHFKYTQPTKKSIRIMHSLVYAATYAMILSVVEIESTLLDFTKAENSYSMFIDQTLSFKNIIHYTNILKYYDLIAELFYITEQMLQLTSNLFELDENIYTFLVNLDTRDYIITESLILVTDVSELSLIYVDLFNTYISIAGLALILHFILWFI